MALFKKAEKTQAYLKAGFLGFAGSGKTYTSTLLAAGLIELGRQRKLEFANKPAFFLDTETGSDWVEPQFRDRDIELFTSKTRSFSDLMTAVREAEKDGSILIVDSITHIWRDLCESYLRRKKRRRLEFPDWSVLKDEWGKFTDAFVNSAVHMILCGRAGYEYDFLEDSDGKKQLEKTGIKMKAESEMGYEPSLLVLMERETEPGDLKKIVRVAHVLKDRATKIDGQAFPNPTFEAFLPHVEFLNLGGAHLGVDTSRTSDEMFDDNGDSRWRWERTQRAIAIEEIEAEIAREWPGQDKDAKVAKAEFVEEIFGTRSWTAVKEMRWERIEKARDQVWRRLRGYPYGQKPEVAAPEAGDAKPDLVDEMRKSLNEWGNERGMTWEDLQVFIMDVIGHVPTSLKDLTAEQLAQISLAASRKDRESRSTRQMVTGSAPAAGRRGSDD